MPVLKDYFCHKFECLDPAMEFIGPFVVKTVEILNFWHKPGTFLKKPFYPDNNFRVIFMMLQINYTNQFLNLAENVLFMQF